MKRPQGARVVGALDTVVLRLGMVIAGLIAIGIVLVVLEANQDNFIVDFFTSIAEFFTAPFDDIFDLDNRDARIALNWGIGAAVYVVLGVVIAGLIGRFAKRSAE